MDGSGSGHSGLEEAERRFLFLSKAAKTMDGSSSLASASMRKSYEMRWGRMRGVGHRSNKELRQPPKMKIPHMSVLRSHSMTTLRTSRSVCGDTPTDSGFRMISLPTCRSLHGFTTLGKQIGVFSAC